MRSSSTDLESFFFRSPSIDLLTLLLRFYLAFFMARSIKFVLKFWTAF